MALHLVLYFSAEMLRMRDPVPFGPLDPGWVKHRIRIRDDQPGSYFRELRNQFFGLLFDEDPGWKKFGSGTGSGIKIPDPQHCAECHTSRQNIIILCLKYLVDILKVRLG
jgi:hypothetical protein